ncbi:MAG: H-NS histone family protein [Chlorobium sp.]|uniref:H-NS histone family protein n=1 Tax=Chlorobium sp. TaxID=1095 RepID=UPI0025C102C9|nr:H-NS histone family protein [Chlorobium sp.]MCF8383759.1 H-NS histone family protein [Chlorobium sp.]
MQTIAELQAQVAAIQKQINEQKAASKREVIADIISRMNESGISINDIQRKIAPVKAKRPKIIKYRLEDKTWSGKGKKPKWVKDIEERGGSVDDYRIA